MLSDLAFELSNLTVNVYAKMRLLLVALGWKSYDKYLAEMKSLLTLRHPTAHDLPQRWAQREWRQMRVSRQQQALSEPGVKLHSIV